MTTTAIPKSVSDFLQRITDLCGTEHADWAENFNACFADTLTTTVKRHDDGTTFLLTGDIPAMWLRDSTAQLRPYLALAAKDKGLRTFSWRPNGKIFVCSVLRNESVRWSCISPRR